MVVARVAVAREPLRVQVVEAAVEVEGRVVEVLAMEARVSEPGARGQVWRRPRLCPAKAAIARTPTRLMLLALPWIVRA